MAQFSCDQKSPCFDPATPFLNTTAEAPDLPIFLARNTGYGPSYPPLGGDWTSLGCTVFCESTVSQVDADQCAARNWMDCISTVWPPTTPLPPILDRFGVPVPNPAPRPIFHSAAQQVELECPDGNSFIYTLRAGVFSGFTQAQADAEALSYARQVAPNFLVCIGELTPDVCCSGITYAGTISASGTQLTNDNSCWSIIGVLPAGITSDLDSSFNCNTGSTTLHFGGTPTTPGVYMFGVQVADALGDYMVKQVTLTVSGLTNTGFADGAVGTDYNPTFEVNVFSAGVTNPIYSIESGALPDGMLLDGGGIIYGTPTTPGTFDFRLGVTEAGTGRMCVEDYSIFVEGGLNFNNLEWRDPPDSLQGDASITNSGNTFIFSVSDDTLNPNSGQAYNTGTMPYTGPAANCVLTLDFTNWTDPFPGLTNTTLAIYVTTTVGGTVQIAALSGQTDLPTTHYVIPFVVPACVADTVFVTFQADCFSNGNGPVTMQATGVLTPAF